MDAFKLQNLDLLGLVFVFKIILLKPTRSREVLETK